MRGGWCGLRWLKVGDRLSCGLKHKASGSKILRGLGAMRRMRGDGRCDGRIDLREWHLSLLHVMSDLVPAWEHLKLFCEQLDATRIRVGRWVWLASDCALFANGLGAERAEWQLALELL